MRYLFFTLIVLLFTGCSSSMLYQYETSKDQLHFKVASSKYVYYDLQQGLLQHQFDDCTSSSYTIEDNALFLEYINLYSQCKWNGSSNGFFEYQMKEQLKLKSLTALQRVESGNYTFSKLVVNESALLYTIHIWSVLTDTFIIDYEGALTKELQTAMNVHFSETTDLPMFTKRYNKSLVRMNFIKSYFNKESEKLVD